MTQQQRDHAKQLTYGLLYGMGAAKLADELGCGLEEAKDAQVSDAAGLYDWVRLARACPGHPCDGVEREAGRRLASMDAGLPGALQTCYNVPSAHSPRQERFRRSLPGVEAWQARVVQECKRQGYVEVGCCACLFVAMFVARSEPSKSALRTACAVVRAPA